MRNVNQEERACRAWPILTEYASNRKKITYGELGLKLGIHPRPIRYVLELIQDYCLIEKLPPLTILAVNRDGILGPGFIAWDINNIPEGVEKVYSYPWSSMPNPFSYATGGQTEAQIADELIVNPDSAMDVYSRVRIRGTAQSIFRKVLLKAYGNRCAFSGIAIPEILDAVHIVPWSKCEPKERLDPRNGLLCTSLHHKLFDTGKILVTEDYRVVVCDDLLRTRNAPEAQNTLITELHGRSIYLPEKRALWPTLEYIRRHNMS